MANPSDDARLEIGLHGEGAFSFGRFSGSLPSLESHKAWETLQEKSGAPFVSSFFDRHINEPLASWPGLCRWKQASVQTLVLQNECRSVAIYIDQEAAASDCYLLFACMASLDFILDGLLSSAVWPKGSAKGLSFSSLLQRGIRRQDASERRQCDEKTGCLESLS